MNRSIREDVHFRSGKQDKKICYNLILEEIEIRSELEETKITENVRYILDLLKSNYEQKFLPKAGEVRDLYVHLVIKEETFTKEFESLNTIGLELECFTQPGGGAESSEITALYTEETGDTIASYTYLYTILERAFRLVFY